MLFVKNSVLMFNFFCFDAWILISNEESDENNVWFGYDIQNTCGFHLGFHWVSKLMHVTNLAIFYWLSKVWIINEFEKHYIRFSLAVSWWFINLDYAYNNVFGHSTRSLFVYSDEGASNVFYSWSELSARRQRKLLFWTDPSPINTAT